MKIIPCRKCPECGKFSDFSVEKCSCGARLGPVIVEEIDIETIPAEQCGEIDGSRTIYYRKCPVCGENNYTFDPEKKIKTCGCCYKIGIENEVAVEFKTEPQGEKDISDAMGCSQKNPPDQTASTQQPEKKNIEKMLENIETKRGGVPVTSDDDDEEIKWSDFTETPDSKNALTLNAVCGGDLKFTITAKDSPYTLGRNSGQSEFLQQDIRIGREHCRLQIQNENWIVVDNNSKNGTFVNSKDLGLGGSFVLHNGDIITLGHSEDSIAFRVVIQ